MRMFVKDSGLKALVCGAVLAGMALAGNAAEVIYNSAITPLGVQAAESREYGDEIRVEGVARIIERFELEYVADYVGGIIPTMQFRLYLNDPNNFFRPGQVLWESEVMPVIIPNGNFGRIGFGSEANPLRYNGAPVVIPEGFDRITFTVDFNGFPDPMDTTPPRNFAGLLFYGNPSPGRSADDYWRRTADGTGWSLVRNAAVTRNNFGAIFYAVPEPSVTALTGMLGAAGVWALVRRRK